MRLRATVLLAMKQPQPGECPWLGLLLLKFDESAFGEALAATRY